jgi:hypothetical protein
MVLIKLRCDCGLSMNMNVFEFMKETYIFWWCPSSMCRKACYTDINYHEIDFDTIVKASAKHQGEHNNHCFK